MSERFRETIPTNVMLIGRLCFSPRVDWVAVASVEVDSPVVRLRLAPVAGDTEIQGWPA